MNRLDDVRLATGPQKAAILMLAVGEEPCAKLVGLMREDEIKAASLAMAQLGLVASGVVESVCAEFMGAIGQTGHLSGGFDSAERLLARALPKERASQIMDEIRGPAGGTMWDKLGGVHETALANYLKDEYPQTIAVVLSRVRADHAARVLALLPESLAIEVVMRMLRMDDVEREVLEGVERTLRAEFMSDPARSTRPDAHEIMAEIFNSLDRPAEERFLAALEKRDVDAADKIKALMFTFNDLQRLAPAAMQLVIRSVAKEKLPLALKGAPEPLRGLFFQNLSERAGKMLRDDIEQLGPVKLRDVDEARAAIVLAAKELAASGQIEIGQAAEEEMVP